AGPVRAQTFTSTVLTVPALGNVQSGQTGNTTFRIAPPGGAVTVIGGTGLRVSAGSAAALIRVNCGSQSQCDNSNALVSITRSGTPTRRGVALANFSVATGSGATATIVSVPAAANTISFQIGPVGQNNNKTFWLGFDYPIQGDNSAAATGTAASAFTVTVSKTNGSSSSATVGNATATVFRRVTISQASTLAFGMVSHPFSGTGTVTIDPSTVACVRSVSGSGVVAFPVPATSCPTYTVTGEGGQVFSTTLGALTMTGPGSIPVALTKFPAGNQTLSNALGAAGTTSFRVGGTFNTSPATPPGGYTGTFSVTVQYN
ncbi:MAG: DUF4402 domain-containing protein, partial [Pseudomonadota bacterium]|nr:DUF4402 domain-containing protein [Pseudomonadota bacterium]